jgi:acetyl-CoA carboxylase carboxyltransferase component
VVTGYGKVDGRLCAVAAYDFTVMAGSMGMTGELKVARLRELALTQRIPMIWLLDSAGARIQEAVGSLFAGTGHLFREEVVMSGVVPQVAALMGPSGAGGLRAHGPRQGVDGAGGSPPGAGGGGRGGDAGRARWLARPLPEVGGCRS